MNAALSTLFRTLFPLLVALAALAVLGLGVAAWATGAGLLAAAAIVLGGLVVLSAAFGLVALQIENTELLRRIAEALEEGAQAGEAPARPEGGALSLVPPAAGPAVPAWLSPPRPAAVPPRSSATRAEPPLRAAAPALRPEPPLRGASGR